MVVALLLCDKNQGHDIRDESDLFLKEYVMISIWTLFISLKIVFGQRTDNFGVYALHEHVGTLKFTLVNCAHIGRSSTPAVVWVTNFLWVSFFGYLVSYLSDLIKMVAK